MPGALPEPGRETLDAGWERHRPAVFGVAYRLLASVAEAQDVVQDVWLRAAAADLTGVRDLRAWLLTVAARTAYNVLASARVRREAPAGPWLPEPLPTGPDTVERVLVDESIGMAMLVVMHDLGPAERVAFVLHDVFELPFDRIAGVLGRSPAAARQLASRARRRVAASGTADHPPADRAERDRVVEAFRAATDAGDLAGLVRLLHPGVVYVADGGGRVPAARRPVHGAGRVALLCVRTARTAARTAAGFAVRRVELGGEPALVAFRDGEPLWADAVEVAAGRITAIRRVAEPGRLTALRGPRPCHI
jgi:RNA polymerase sigma factor (sigma-70 family)